MALTIVTTHEDKIELWDEITDIVVKITDSTHDETSMVILDRRQVQEIRDWLDGWLRQ